MKNLNNYILEKLYIGKDYNASDLDKDGKYYNIVCRLFNDNNDLFNTNFEESLAVKYAYKANSKEDLEEAVMLYAFIMLYTRSTPKISPKENLIYSAPGNYGLPLVNKLIKKGIKPEYIIDKCNALKNIVSTPKELPEMTKHFDTLIKFITDRLGGKFEVKLVQDDINNYSANGLKSLSQDINKGTSSRYEIIPFVIKNDKAEVKCEIEKCGEYKVMAYRVNGKEYHFSDAVVQKISELIS